MDKPSWSQIVQQQQQQQPQKPYKIPKKSKVQQPPPPPTPPTKNQQQNTVGKWPQSLQRFVERAYETVKNNKKQKLKMQQYLSKIITQAESDGTIWKINWDLCHLPEYSDNPKMESSLQEKKRKMIEAIAKKSKKQKPENFIGRSKELEKQYLRLTSAPDINTVRPEYILKKSFIFVIEKHSKNPNDYNYICEQLKSIRQDLTVQSIKNDFTVSVYETHARLSLKFRDITEFNQCQTQLLSLYDDGLKGCKFEFISYQILYLIYQNEIIDLTTLLSSLSNEMRENNFIKFALSVYNYWSMKNFHKIFKNEDERQPSCSKDLFGLFINKYRFEVLKIITKSFRPSIDLEFLQKELDFKTKNELFKFLKEKNVTFLQGNQSIDCKLTYQKLLTNDHYIA
eukprot:gene5978-9977_t